jgi:hypothetical protein
VRAHTRESPVNRFYYNSSFGKPIFDWNNEHIEQGTTDMTTNPYRPQYTETQSRRVETERQRLLKHFNTLRDGQPTQFQVVYEGEVIENDRLVDEFVAAPASAQFSDQWRRELDSHARVFHVEHGARRFSVLVDHKHYLNQSLVPVSIDAGCASASALQVAMAVALLYAAMMLSGAAT